MKIAKFGGSSVANASQIKKVCDIVLADSERKLVVVSAPGKRDRGDIKVTDLLIACAEAVINTGSYERELSAIINRFASITHELSLSDDILTTISEDLKYRINTYINNNERLMDALKAAGEDNCAKVVAAYLNSLGHSAKYINPKDAGLLLSDEAGNAQVLDESYENLKALKNENCIMIFPGFFGYTKTGDIVTFPRGGSDITGSILAAAVNADLYENFTDVDAVFVANPNVIQNPQAISNLTYREMRELSYSGFSVLQEEALAPVFRAGIPVCIRNTNNISAPGTLITLKRQLNKKSPVSGISSDNDFCTISLSKYLMNREIGFGRKLLNILEDEGLSYEHMPSGVDNLSVVLHQNQFSEISEERVIDRIKRELKVDEILVRKDRCIITIVGEGMISSLGVASRAASALSKAYINIEMISQGSSEISMMFIIKNEYEDAALQALYEEFFN